MSDEPSYQYRGPTKQVVYTYILHMIHSSVEWNKLIQMNQRLPYRILEKYTNIIEKKP